MKHLHIYLLRIHFYILSFFIVTILPNQGISKSSFNSGFQVTVFDAETLEPLIGATIANRTSSWGVITDESGIAAIRGIPLDERLFVRYTGYETVETSLQEMIDQKGQIPMVRVAYFFDELEIVGATKAVERQGDVAHQVTVLNTKDIAILNPQNTADLLGLNGVFVQKSQMGGGSPVIRGFEANKLLIVIDGVRLNNAIYRAGHLQNVITIDNAILDRTEIVQGPASVIYGSDALGGVMHFFTKEPVLNFRRTQEQHIEGTSYVRYATANGEKAFHLDINYGRDRFAALSSFTVSDFSDLRAGRKGMEDYPEFGYRKYYAALSQGFDTLLKNPDPLVQVRTAYTQYDFLQKIKIQPSDKFGFTFNFQYSTTGNVPRYDELAHNYNIEVEGGDTTYNYRYAEWDYGPQNRLFASFRTRIIDEENPLFNDGSIILSYQKVDEDRITRRFANDWRQYQLEDVNVAAVNADFLKVFSKEKGHKLLYGLEYNYNYVSSNAYNENIFTREIDNRAITRYPNGGSKMTMAAAYLNYRRQFFSNRVKFMAGTRYTFVDLKSIFYQTDFLQLPFDSINISSSTVTGSISFVWNITKNLYLDAVAATAFRAPNVDDYGKVRVKANDVLVPNNELDSEKSMNGEISLSNNFFDKVRISGTYFYTYIFDAIVRDNYTLTTSSGQKMDSLYVDGQWSRIQANVNAGRAFITGASGNILISLLSNLQIQSSLNYTYGYKITEQEPLSHIPPLYGQTTISYKNERVELRAAARYNGWKNIADYSLDGEDNPEYATPDGTPAWITYNLYGTLKLRRSINLNIAVENILDLHYRPFASGVSAAGRNFILSLRINF